MIPVWVTECEQETYPIQKARKGAGAPLLWNRARLDYCRQRFAEQWTALRDRTGPTCYPHQEPVANERSTETVELGRTNPRYFDKHTANPLSHALWLVYRATAFVRK